MGQCPGVALLGPLALGLSQSQSHLVLRLIEEGPTSFLTHVVVGGIQLLNSCGTENALVP